MKEFEQMEPVVDAICESLENEPYEWKVGIHHIHHPTKFNSIKIAIHNMTEHWPSSSVLEKIFSKEQAKRIRKSYNILMEIRGNDSQQELVKSLEKQKAGKQPSARGIQIKPTIFERFQSWIWN